MLQIELERSLAGQSLHIFGDPEGCEGVNRSDFREQMLMNNDIDGVLKYEVRRTDDRKCYDYEVSGKDTLEAFFSRKKADRNTTADILKGILGTVYRSREYMLKESDFVIAPDTVFIDKEGKVFLVYRSGYGVPLAEQLTHVAEYFMNKVDNSDDGAVLLIYNFYMRTKDSTCTIEDLLSVIATKRAPITEEDLRDTRVRIPEPGTAKTAGEQKVSGIGKLRTEIDLFLTAGRPMKLKALLALCIGIGAAVTVFCLGRVRGTASLYGQPMKVILSVLIGFGVTVMLQGIVWLPYRSRIGERIRKNAEEREEPTVLIDPQRKEPEAKFVLVSDEYDAISADHFPYYVGKDPKKCDHVLNYPGVSRCHMRIDYDPATDQYLITDLNSTNGTFINSEKLESLIEYSVTRGDEILIGGCIFYCN